jgi:hypothetical protein
MGEYTNGRPAFKLIVEKVDDFTAVDIKAFMQSYREANRPNAVGKKMTTQEMGTDSSQHDSWRNSELTDKSKAQAALEKLGVSVFMPDSKMRNLDWV